MPQKFVWLALAGAMGTVFRYALAGAVHRIDGTSFPWGTVVVNLTGCFLAGLLWSMLEARWSVSGETRTVILIGFLGAFTTFSALILETGKLLRSAEWLYAGSNLILQNGLGLLALFFGAALGRMI